MTREKEKLVIEAVGFVLQIAGTVLGCYLALKWTGAL